MILKEILAISGQPGLFKFIAQGKNAIIVEHLETGKRSSAFSSSKVSSLEDISVFTEEEDLPLGKVFDRIYEKTGNMPAIDSRADTAELKKYFEEIVPEYSRDKVYVSDIRKIFQWYNILQKNDLLVAEKPSGTDTPAETVAETGKEEALAKEKSIAGPDPSEKQQGV